MIYGKAPLLMALKDGVKGRGQMPVKSSMSLVLQMPIVFPMDLGPQNVYAKRGGLVINV